MAPQTVSNSNQNRNRSNEILGKLNDLATQLQTLGQSVFQQVTPPVVNLTTPPQGPSGTANPPSHLSAFGSLNPNTTIPEKIKREVLSGEFFELCKLLPKNLSNFHKDNEPVEVSLNGTTLKTTQPKTKKTITTIEGWSTAFSSYTAIIIEKFPERAQELIQYLMTIRYAANNTTGLAWVVYDNQFRTQAANNRNLNWGHIDMQLWVKIFGVAPSRLREEYSIFEHGPQPKGTRGAGTCFQFNRAGVICKRQDCPYQHKCSNCFGNHPGFKCPNKGGGTQQTPKATQSKLPQPNKLSKFTAKTPIDVDRLELELSDHPDKLFVENLCRDLREGTRIGYTGPRAPRNSKNLPSAYQSSIRHTSTRSSIG